MIGEHTQRQIIAFSNDGAPPEEIATELGIEEAAVRLVLNANNTGPMEDRDINDSQLAILRRKAYDLAVGSEDDSVAAKMTMFLIERDKPSVRKDTNVSPISQINIAIANGNARYEELLKEHTK